MEIIQEQTADYMRLPAIDLMNNWLTAVQVRRGDRQ
jgi:hypothetical protein